VGNPRVVQGIEALRAIVGEPLGPSPGKRIDQAAVAAFADVTGDHQWIHLDVARASATPFSGTIIHGYFVLSLVPTLLFDELLRIEGVGTILNYGLDKLRFPDVARAASSRPSGSRSLRPARASPAAWPRSCCCCFRRAWARRPGTSDWAGCTSPIAHGGLRACLPPS
jgi:MaoC like domain